MANIKYFSGETELQHIHGMDNDKFALSFPTIRGLRYDGFQRLVGYLPNSRTVAAVERRIEYKSNPSMHICDSRCMNARGRSCECSCGGKNHGAGSFQCAALI